MCDPSGHRSNSNQMVTGWTLFGNTTLLGLRFPPELFVSLKNHLKFLIFPYNSPSRFYQHHDSFKTIRICQYLCPIFCHFLKNIKCIFFLFLKFASCQVIKDIFMLTNLLIRTSLQIKTTGE